MASVIHQVPGSYVPSSSSRKKGIKLTQNLTSFCTFQRLDDNLNLNNVGPRLINGSKWKYPRISSFKGNIGSEGYRDRVRGSQGTKNLVKLSYMSLNGGLTSLPTASPKQDQTLEGSSLHERKETNNMLMKCGVLQTVWCKFLSLDAKIKIPAMIFIPLFLIVKIKYGAHVANELSPLWIGGPLLIALYIKMVQVIYSLYVFSFKQSVKMVYNFTREKESIRVHIWQNVVYYMNVDYKDEFKRIRKHFQVWIGDMCLDFVESMWSYRKTLWFLKMANIM